MGAISKFDGHLFTYNFKNKRIPCLRCFFQEKNISDDFLNCEYEGVLGTIAGIIGTLQANEILKQILNIGDEIKFNNITIGKILINTPMPFALIKLFDPDIFEFYNKDIFIKNNKVKLNFFNQKIN